MAYLLIGLYIHTRVYVRAITLLVSIGRNKKSRRKKKDEGEGEGGKDKNHGSDVKGRKIAC